MLVSRIGFLLTHILLNFYVAIIDINNIEKHPSIHIFIITDKVGSIILFLFVLYYILL